jgi:UPF0755 protein
MIPVLIALALTAVGAAWWSISQYGAPGPLAETKTLIFRKGTGFEGIAGQLAEGGVVRREWFFKAASVATRKAKKFKAGEYEFPAGINVKDVIAMLAEGRVVIHKITVIEGWSSQEIAKRLLAESVLEGDLPEMPEGSILPETYHFTYGDTRFDVVTRMQTSMKQVLHELWEKRKEGLPLHSPHDALVLASIVESETNLDEERGRVAAVYINRLRKGMKLQADPTVAYGIEKAKGAPMARALTLNDLKDEKNPYNTYAKEGLPPTPISNPGRASIAAALNPPQTNEYYFVATGNGGHNFAATAAEHGKNVTIYRAAQAKAAAAAKKDDAPKKDGAANAKR